MDRTTLSLPIKIMSVIARNASIKATKSSITMKIIGQTSSWRWNMQDCGFKTCFWRFACECTGFLLCLRPTADIRSHDFFLEFLFFILFRWRSEWRFQVLLCFAQEMLPFFVKESTVLCSLATKLVSVLWSKVMVSLLLKVQNLRLGFDFGVPKRLNLTFSSF